LEADLAIANSAPTDWPPSEVRELILSLSAGAPLVSLFSLIQQRYQRRVLDAQRLVAEMSLDWVEFQFASGQDHYMVLEIELLPDGTLTDLDNLVSMAKARWALRGMFQSKFQRALALYLRSSAQGTTSSAIGFDTDKTCITGVDGVDRDGSNSCRLLER
jgi:inorganic triphosphatase YgiF